MTHQRILACLVGLLAVAMAEEYQWQLPVDAAAYPGIPFAKEVQAQAFLWIPPDCQRVRAVVLAQNNMEEPAILAHPAFRRTMAELGFAELFVNRTLGSIHFRHDRGEGPLLEALLRDCARLSGYGEIEHAPLVPMGHSAMAELGWDIGMWNPGRTLAALSISGMWPFFKDQTPDKLNGSPDFGNLNLDGVPGLITKGEYEVGGNLLKGWYFNQHANYRERYPNTVLTQVVEPGGGHFEVSDEKVAFLCRYLRTVARHRLPAAMPGDGPVALIPITPTGGWLYDAWRLDQAPTAPAAPHAAYQGKRHEAFFAFDADMARMVEDFQAAHRGKTAPYLNYRTPGKGIVPHAGDHIDCHIPFEPAEDGVTLRIAGVFADTFPWKQGVIAGRTVKKGDPVAYPAGEEDRIRTRVICGPGRQSGPQEVTVSLDRTVTRVDPSQPLVICTWLDYPGNATWKRMVQQGEVRFWPNRHGRPQTIIFPEIPDQDAASLKPLRLTATSSAGLRVRYFVRSGPAEVDDQDRLVFTRIPPRSRFPLAVTVVAWQLGRYGGDQVQAAPLVERTFRIHR